MCIGSKNNGITWIDFRYEKLPFFCLYYGKMGHNMEYCNKIDALVHGITKVNPLGPWLKATYLGRKHISIEDRKFSSIPIDKPIMSMYSPIDKSMLEQMEVISLKEESKESNEEKGANFKQTKEKKIG